MVLRFAHLKLRVLSILLASLEFATFEQQKLDAKEPESKKKNQTYNS